MNKTLITNLGIVIATASVLAMSPSPSAKEEKPGYMTPFGIPLGESFDSSAIEFARKYDPRDRKRVDNRAINPTDSRIDHLRYNSVEPPEPNPMFDNSGGNGYGVWVTRNTETVWQVSADFDANDSAKITIRSCDQVRQVRQYFEQTYSDLRREDERDDGYEFRTVFRSTSYPGVFISISCRVDRVLYAAIVFKDSSQGMEALRDKESAKEQVRGF